MSTAPIDSITKNNNNLLELLTITILHTTLYILK